MITNDLALAIDSLHRDEVIGLPTETVYGLAANALSTAAVRRIYDIKKRPSTHPLIVHAATLDQAIECVDGFSPQALLLADAFWPGPLTLLIEKHDRIPDLVTAGSPRVAIRIPDHPIALELLSRLPFPLVAPSANPFTKVSPTRAEDVQAYFGTLVPVILQGGPSRRGIESTIVGFEKGVAVIYRLGAIPVESIERLIGPVTIYQTAGAPIVSPGNAQKHYAPDTPLVVSADNQAYLKSHPGLRAAVFAHRHMVPDQLAPVFYSRLKELDRLGYDVLLAEWFPDEGLGRTLNDRLRRSAQFSDVQ